ncbi:hypothetical protein OHA84_35425 [Streptomyces sp. NBC_00513]|uniref:hypothetical protein n=1 Tax=unclassified Streptomyces TaxID=2593676 RepID=UPI0022506AB5|nr:hypothetical protein [Streptomyces sp. NBC_00424]MCX5071196.1 hypothetical protein [Streptomyces sp. NBC_00424]WUD45388.1 hypothetical protein OHA84_35425 [Streptomyces sp. NBC_00513]
MAFLPLQDRIRDEIAVRIPDASDGALDIGAAIGWTTALLANLATVGVLAAVFGVAGAVTMRWAAPPAGRDFTRARRAFSLAWLGFVFSKLLATALGTPMLGWGDAADAVPALTRLDVWTCLLAAALFVAGRAVGTPRPRAVGVAAALTALYTGTLLLLPGA